MVAEEPPPLLGEPRIALGQPADMSQLAAAERLPGKGAKNSNPTKFGEELKDVVADLAALVGAIKDDGGARIEALEAKLDSLAVGLSAIESKIDKLAQPMGPPREVPRVTAQPSAADLARDLREQVKAVARTHMAKLRSHHEAIVVEDPKEQAAKVMALGDARLAVLLDWVAVYIKDTLATLAAKLIVPSTKYFDIQWILDPLVVSALVAGLTRVPGYGDEKARQGWTHLLLQDAEHPCTGCGMELADEGGHHLHPGIPGYRGGKAFPARDCKPPAKKCLCPTVFALYLGVTGRKVPHKADKAHGPKVCPLGRHFSKVGLWSAWIKAAPERASAVACSPLVTKREADREYTDL